MCSNQPRQCRNRPRQARPAARRLLLGVRLFRAAHAQHVARQRGQRQCDHLPGGGRQRLNHGVANARALRHVAAALPQRAANYDVAISGEIDTVVLKDGAQLISAAQTPGKMTIFPTGSLHAMQNKGG